MINTHKNTLPGLMAICLLAYTGLTHALNLKFTQVTPGVYAHIGETAGRTYANEGMNANTGFIVTKAGVVVVDSGATYQVAKAIHQEIKKVTQQPVKYVVNTGGQDHRWLGNGYFREQGAQIIAHPKAKADMQDRAAVLLAGLKTELKEKLDGTVAVYSDRLFEQKETLQLGGEEIQVLFFYGGHTPGDAVVWLPKTRTLFSGDQIYVDRLLSILPISNSKYWLASFEAIEKLKPKTIIPGHGKVCDLQKAQQQTGNYLKLLRSHMRKAIDANKDLQTAINSLDQSAYKHLDIFEQLKGGNASRVYLEMETE